MQPPAVVSPDGYWAWNGNQWVPNVSAPAAVTSPDGYWMWNGVQWVPNTYRAIPPYMSAGFRATMTTLFLALNVFGMVLLIAFDVVDAMRIQQAAPSGSTLDVATGLTALFATVGYYGSFIPAVVFFCMWLHRIVRNMPSLGSPDPRFSPALAVGLSFVPFVNLIQPLSSVLDAWRGSPADHRWLDRQARRSGGVPVAIVIWWAAWLGSRAVTWSAFLLSRDNESPLQFVSAFVDIAGNLVLVIAAVMLLRIVRGLTARQERRHELIESGRLA